MRHKIVCMSMIVVSLHTAANDKINRLYGRLDKVLANKTQYQNRHEENIRTLRKAFQNAQSWDRRYELSQRLFREYETYMNDSALTYIHHSMEAAHKMGNKALAAYSRALMVMQCSKSGLYAEGIINLEKINRNDLDTSGRLEYYKAAGNLYGQIGTYTNDDVDRDIYIRLSKAYEDTLMQISPRDNPYYLMLKQMRQMDAGDYAGALATNDLWYKTVERGTHEDAVVLFYRHDLFEKMGNMEGAIENLIKSAICDVENVTYDEASLIFLSHYLRGQGDTKRAQTYISYSYAASTVFGARMKNWATMELEAVSSQYRQQLQENNTKILVGTFMLTLLALVTLGMFFFVHRQRDKLKQSNKSISMMNKQLQDANELLNLSNKQKDEANGKLHESNIIKEEYIGMFIGLCASYIDQQDKFRKNVNKMMRNRQYDEVFQLSKDTEAKDYSYNELFERFDWVFLSLFPNFVEQFNNLLSEPYRIKVTGPHRLTTPLRIFALIRLGIDDSSKISKFLNLANSTVYNYRTKLRNGTIGDRNTFEDEVKLLGVIKEYREA